jgi:preprotein translocase subunit SecG
MYTAVIVLITIVCLLLALVVLVQNSKGGGLAAGFSSSNQIMGVRKTTDILEKLTWGFAIALFVLSVAGTMLLPRNQEVTTAPSAIQEQIDNAALPGAGIPQAPAGGTQQPATGQQPAANQPIDIQPSETPVNQDEAGQ